jgi:hypothetical protein
MAIKIADAFINITGKTQDLDRDLHRAKGHVNSFIDEIRSSMIQEFGASLFHGIVSAARSVVSFIGDTVQATSNLTEAMTKTIAIYGESSKAILAWSETTARSMGLSQTAALTAMSSLGNMFVQLGASTEEASKLSMSLVTLAGDLASFHNVAGGAEEVLISMQAGLRGEYDSLQKYIPTINAAAIEQQALADTGKEAAKQLTVLDKALATQKLIVEGAGAAMGDFERTTEGVANQQRILSQQIEDAQAKIGSVFAPVYATILRGLNELLELTFGYGDSIIENLANGMAQAVTAMIPVLQQIRALFVYWLAPGSPPRILPELTDWGKSYTEELLHGMTLADFDALKTLGGIMESTLRSLVGQGGIADTDLVSKVFGTTEAISAALRNFKDLGAVTQDTLDNIESAAGPAGRQIASLVNEYFKWQAATEAVNLAQKELNDIMDRYAEALSPVEEQLDAVRNAQRQISENQQLGDLGEILKDPTASVDEKRMARLQIEEIQLERQARAIEDERDVAVDASQQKVDAAKAEEDAQASKYAAAQAAIEQSNHTNALLQEEYDLRLKIANEALAAQEKAIREAEQAAREEAAAMERVADAQLRWQLGTTDTAGQLAILNGELAKTEVGSAEYYDLLLQIHNLQTKMADEAAAAAGAGGGGPFGALIPSPEETEKLMNTSEGIQKLSDALDQAFEALKGGEGQEVKLDPAWQDFADMLGTIQKAAEEAKPIIEGVADLVTGKEVKKEALSDPFDPFAGNFWLGGLIPGLKGMILTLDELKRGDWKTLWDRYKWYVDNTMGAGGDTFGLMQWIEDTVIPMLTILADEGWKGIWTIFKKHVDDALAGPLTPADFKIYTWLKDTGIPLLEGMVTADGDWDAVWKLYFTNATGHLQGIVDFFTSMITTIEEKATALDTFIRGMWAEWGEDIPDALQFPESPSNPTSPPPLPPPIPPSGKGGQDWLPPSDQASYSGGPLAMSNDTYFINQQIGINGDFGGARQGAQEGIREALLNRRTIA